MKSCRTRLGQVFCIVALFAAIVFSAVHSVPADSFDWRYVDGHNWNSSIKSQFGGTCWDFSACGTLEAKYRLTRNDFSYDADVSEQHICWETNPDMGGTGGGWGPSVLNYFTYHGVVSEAECPAQGTDVGTGPYWPIAAGWESRVFKSVSVQTDFTTDINVMKLRLKTQGPLEVGVLSTNDLFNSVAELKANYRGPVAGLDHEVSLVGYYDDASIPSGGYWVIKNSWGTGAGDNGYYYIPYGDIENHNDVSAITGAVYYTGAMATATWKGGSSIWSSGGTNWTNNVGGSAYAWENKETTATFNASTGTAVTLIGPVVSHGLTINSGATGYTFTGGSLTVTSAGIIANESATFNSPLYVGAPQTWTIASGKTLTVGTVHTIISDLTLAGDGNTTVTGLIDGGGVLNIFGGAAPGKITKTGNGTLSFTGTATYTAALNVTAGTLNFAQSSGESANFSGVISGSRPVNKINEGTSILSGTNTYTSTTTVTGGALQADSGVGLPSGSFLSLNGGVIQSNGTTTFTRSLGSSGSNKFRLTSSGGGFSAGAGPMTVNIGGNGTPSLLNWGTTVGTNIVGTLKFGSLTAANVTTFQNRINLSGATRTIQVDDNANSLADYAVMSGVISNSGGTYGIQKTGPGLLVLNAANTYNGPTTVSAGALQADFGVGIPGVLALDGGVLQSSITSANSTTFTRNLGTASGTFQWATGGGGFSAGAGPMTVNVGGNGTPSMLSWGANVGSNIVGTLKFGSLTAMNVTTFQNPIDLGGANRAIQVDDNLLTAADYAVMSGVISNSTGTYGIQKTGPGLLMLTGANTYNGATTISAGALQADLGTGIPAASLLSLDGGVLQSNGPLTFTRSLGTSGSDFQWTAGGGGFSAGAGPLTINIGGNAQPDTLVWGANVGSEIVGTLKLSSTTAANTTLFQNNIDLGGGDRTLQVDDNPNSTNDSAQFSGNVSGSGSFTITGSGQLRLMGTGNTYTGSTTISGGTVDLATTDGPAIPGNLNLSAVSGVTQVRIQGSNQILPSSVVSFGGSAESRLILLGRSLTLAGISDANGYGVIENTQDQTGVSNLTLTVDNSADCSFAGSLRNTATGSGTLAIVKNGSAALTLSGSNIAYTGGTTINAGRLVLQDVTNAAFLGTSITNHAALEFNAAAANINFTSTISGAGSLTKSGPGAATLAGSGINYSGGTTINDGTLVLKDTTNAAFMARAITDNATLELNAATVNLSYSGVISGSGALVKTGPNILTISGSTANTYTGDTYVNGGVLALAKTSGLAIPGNLNLSAASGSTETRIQGNNQLSTTAVVSFLGGYWPHFELVGHTITLGGISDLFGTGVIENTQDQAGISTNGVLILESAANWTFSGLMRDGNFGGSTGKLALIKNGSGVLTLSGLNCGAYTGGLTVNNGTLDYSSGTLPNCYYIISGGKLNIGALSQSIGIFRITGGTVDGTGTLTSYTSYDIRGGAVNASLGGTNIALNKTISSTAILGGANSYSGTTTISAGALQADDGVGIPTASFLKLNGGVLQSNTATTFTRGLGTSGNAFQWATSGGGFAAGGGVMTVNIGGGAALTWGTTVGTNMVGTLKLSSTTAAAVTNFQNAIDLNGLTRTIQVDDNTLVSTDYAVISGVISNSSANSAGIYKSGAGLLVLTANNTFNGASTINGGTLQVGDGGATGTLPGNVANNNTLAFNRSDNIAFDGIISGSGELIQQGTGMLSLTSANSYSGKTTIAAGTLALATDGQIDPLSTIDNSSIFLVSEGAHTVGEIIGSGATFVAGSAQLSASSIIQNMLMIGGNFSAFIASNSYSTPVPVPEPSTLALMMSLGAVGIGAVIRHRRHRR